MHASPLSGLRSAWLEFRNFKASGWLLFSICCIALIPVIYAGLFLLAFLDPYGSLSDVPAAVVNLDQGATISDEERNIGQELCDSLVENNEDHEEGQATGFNWKFVSQEDADAGLRDATYYMELIIPENFSQAIADADSDNPEQVELQAYFNPSTNLIAQTVGSSMVTKIKAELNTKIQKEYFDNIFVSLSDASDDLVTAVDGSQELSDGLKKLQDGSSTLTDGIQTAQDGADTLASGSAKLESGSSTLTTGLQTAETGAQKLIDGAKSAEKGSGTLGKGLTTLRKGEQSLESGISSAADGSKTITDNLGTLASGASQVSDGVSTVGSSLNQLDEGIKAAQKNTSDLSAVITGVAEALTAYSKTSQTDPSKAQEYLTKASALAAAAEKASPEIGKDLNSYVSSLISKLSAYQTAYAKSAAASSTMASKKKTMEEKKSAMETAQKATKDPTTDLQKKAAAFKADLAENDNNLSKALSQFQSDYQKDPTDYATLLGDASALAKSAGGIISGQTTGSGVELLLSLSTFQSALSGYQSAANDYQDAAADYQEAASDYSTAATDMANAGAEAKEAQGLVTGYLTGVKNTSAVASESTSTVASAVEQLSEAVNGKLVSGASSVTEGAKKLQSGSSTLTTGLITAETGAQKLVKGAKSAEKGSKTLTSGLTTLRKGEQTLKAGISTAADGSKTITYNLGKITSGANTLSDGLGDAVEGSDKITTNLGTAKDGSDELHDGLEDGQETMADSVSNSDAKSEMMSEPVSANGSNGTGESITQVKNYGTGFAPYFIGLGMWVGCLMITFLVRSVNNRLLMSRASSLAAVSSSYIPMLAIAVIQVLILLLFIQFGLKLNVSWPLEYYLFGLLVAACFVAIIQFIRSAFGTAGMVLIVVLLMLQLCTAAGTFPIEAELPIFNYLNPFLPMTYVVQGFRMAMCGLEPSLMVHSAVVLGGFTIAFLFLSVLLAHHRRRATMEVMYPKIQMQH